MQITTVLIMHRSAEVIASTCFLPFEARIFVLLLWTLVNSDSSTLYIRWAGLVRNITLSHVFLSLSLFLFFCIFVLQTLFVGLSSFILYKCPHQSSYLSSTNSSVDCISFSSYLLQKILFQCINNKKIKIVDNVYLKNWKSAGDIEIITVHALTKILVSCLKESSNY